MTAFIIIWSIWFLSEIFLNRLFRSGENDKRDQDRGTMRIIWITIGIANSLGIIMALLVNLPISSHLILPYSGLLVIILGMIIRFYSIVSLGRLFTVDVTIRNNHKIKQDGVYRFIRHPSYLGSLVSFLGFGISLNNWISLLIITIMVTIAMLNRIRIEERLLLEQFGPEYSKYMKKTYRLIPWIY
jgi:protein-S-isoprenylcysteine O-methyltransferase Ste14